MGAWTSAYTEAVKTKKEAFLLVKPRQLLELDGKLLLALPKEKDRKILHNRLNEYLNGKRRGRLRLPNYFPREVRRLIELSKTEIRQSQYWVKPSTLIRHRLTKSMSNWLNRVAPGRYWTTTGASPVALANAVVMPRLRKRDEPRNSRALWPSCPSLIEATYMSRNGRFPSFQDKFKTLKVTNHLRLRDLKDSLRLATQVVRRSVIGIRSEIEVPKKFLQYFRYRHGFSILSVRHCLPAGLVRFLLAQWVRAPYSLWLVEPLRLKIFLRRRSWTDFIRSTGSISTVIGCAERPSTKGKVSSSKARYRARRKLDKDFDHVLKTVYGLPPALT